MSRETPAVFAGGRLLGILSEPEPRHADRPCVVLLNAGLLPRPGPGRLSVQLSRALCAAGFPVFRFDLSGLGDSEPRPAPLPAAESIVADVRAALDHLGSGAPAHRRFVLAGLCSGAVGAHYAAVADPRVVGVAAFDGYSFPTLRSKLAGLRWRLEDPVGLVRGLIRHLRPRSGGPAPAGPADPDESFLPRWPKRQQAEKELDALVRRNVQLLYVFSGEWDVYRYEGQLRDAFPAVPFAGLLTERRIPRAEHLYFTRPERQQVLELVSGWLARCFPAGGADAPRAQLPLTVIFRMRSVGEAELPRNTRSLPTASTSSSICFRLPAIVTSWTGWVSVPFSIQWPTAPCE